MAFQAPWVTLDPSDALVIKEIEGERDRGAALITAAFIDERLFQTIKLRLRPEMEDAKKSHNALFKGTGGPLILRAFTLAIFFNYTRLRFLICS